MPQKKGALKGIDRRSCREALVLKMGEQASREQAVATLISTDTDPFEPSFFFLLPAGKKTYVISSTCHSR
jgi:hypothetical protein